MDKHDLYGKIGNRVRDVRKAKRLTQQFVAGKMNVKRTSITNLESGKQCPSLDFIYRLCNLLDIDVYEILPSSDEWKSSQERGEKVGIRATGALEVSKSTYDLIEKIKGSEEQKTIFHKTEQAIDKYSQQGDEL